MKIIVLGAGLMGPAAAYNAMTAAEVSQVILADADGRALQHAVNRLAGRTGADKLGVVRLDLNHQETAIDLLANFDAAIAALPAVVSPLAMSAALQAGTPLVDLAMIADEMLPPLQAIAQQSSSPVVLACGLEPGLTEIWARYLAEQLHRVDELHIKCGGIPAEPQPPLGYKILFGGSKLPLHEAEAQQVVDGKLVSVPRYSGVEPITFDSVGLCEAWHEGFMPWLLDIPALQQLRRGTQKTVRWPGFAQKAALLKELGLLSSRPVEVHGAAVPPKALLDALLYPRVKLDEGEADITLFQVSASGRQHEQLCRVTTTMIDRYDEASGLTAMARTTAFTGAIVARMLATGQVAAEGLVHPEQIVHGPAFDSLIEALAAEDIVFQVDFETL